MATESADNRENPQMARYNAPLEKAFDSIATPFEEFIHKESASGLLLMACAILALVVANSFLADTYLHILHTPITLGFGDWVLQKTLHHWINDGLMALFFFVVGLEIKREILVGELSSVRQAMLPVFAAIGGMLVPAAVYYLVNFNGGDIGGWGIPMATDIAFAIGALVLLGSRIPRTLLTFLVALAIVDDLGAVLVIAVFYTEDIVFSAIGLAVILFAMLVFLNLFGIRKPIPYFVIGGLLWLAMLKSGVHSTLAGVLTALTIPARPKYDSRFFSQHVGELRKIFDASYKPGESILRNDTQRAILQTLENVVHKIETPLQRLEHSLHIPVAFLIIPLFALANAGIPIELGSLTQTLAHPVALGVMTGLVIGKLVGIAGFSWLAIRLGLAELPQGVRFSQIIGVALLGGIGFTMSIFIAELAFSTSPEALLMAKTGVLFGSLVAGVTGYLWLWNVIKRS